jgi:hypothetical protein
MALIQFTGSVNDALRVKRWAVELWHVHQRDQFFYQFTSKDGGVDDAVPLRRGVQR